MLEKSFDFTPDPRYGTFFDSGLSDKAFSDKPMSDRWSPDGLMFDASGLTEDEIHAAVDRGPVSSGSMLQEAADDIAELRRLICAQDEARETRRLWRHTIFLFLSAGLWGGGLWLWSLCRNLEPASSFWIGFLVAAMTAGGGVSLFAAHAEVD